MNTVTKRYNVSFSKSSGETRRWVKVGKAVEWDGETIEIELDSVPAGAWDGKLKLFKADDTTSPRRDSFRAGPRGRSAG